MSKALGKPLPAEIKKSFKAALKVRLNSHSPYSKFKVGAALGLKGVKNLVLGTNVENASFGGTICAERSAIMSAIAQYGKKDFRFITVVGDTIEGIVPCAFCLQVISEFADGNFKIHCANLKGIQQTYTLDELLPVRFSGRDL